MRLLWGTGIPFLCVCFDGLKILLLTPNQRKGKVPN